MAKPFPKSVGFLAGAEGNSNDDRGVVGDDLLAGIGDAPACSPFHPDAIARAAGTSGEGDDLLKRPRDVAHQDLHTFSSKQVRDTFGNGGLGEREREGEGGQGTFGRLCQRDVFARGIPARFQEVYGSRPGGERADPGHSLFFPKFTAHVSHISKTFPDCFAQRFGRAPVGEGKPPVHLREMM